MKKKAIVALTAAGVLFAGGGAYTIFAESAGYESYKEAMVKTHTITNATADMEMSVTDNGKLLIKSDTTMQFDKKNNLAAAEVSMTSGGSELNLNGFLKDRQPVIQAEGSETYFTPDAKHPEMDRKDGEKFHDPEMMKLGELIIDAIAAPIKGEFEQQNNTIILDMNRDDFPELIHSIGKQAVKMGFKAHSDISLEKAEYPFLEENFKASLPKLEEDISIDRAYVKVELAEAGHIQSQEAVFEISGKDEKGESHKIKVEMDLVLENVNKTDVKVVDLSGKTVQSFKMKKIH